MDDIAPLSDQELAATVKAWRGKHNTRAAATAIGLSPRTIENIEQGRGYSAQRLLLIALRATPLGT